MHVAVLGSPQSWYLQDLQRAAAGRHSITSVTFRDLNSSIGQEGFTTHSGDWDLQACDALLVRTMPPGSLEQVILRMDVLGRLEAAGQLIINPPRAIEAAVDKYLATARLHQAGLLVPRTWACQTVDDAMAAFEALGGDVVVKPLFGSEGRGITRINDEGVARRVLQLLAGLGAVLYVQEFVPHAGYDLRILVIGDDCFAMRRSNPLDWRTNVSRGAIAEPVDLTPEMADLARRAAAAVGAPLAGVDLLPGNDGALYTIEVNAVPGWKALSAALNIDIAMQVLRYLQCRIASQ